MEKENKTESEVVDKDMIIADVIKKYPAAAEVMASYGLTCIGCHSNPYESIEAGARVHGMSDGEIEEMIKDINEIVGPSKSRPEKIIPLSMTDIAVNKIKSIMESKGKKDYGFRVGVKPGGCAGYSYFMDFEKESGEKDAVLDFEGLKVFIDPESYKKLGD